MCVGIENSSKGSGLEYGYIDVRDDYRDDHTRLSVWVLDGDPAHVDLLKFALNEETFQVKSIYRKVFAYIKNYVCTEHIGYPYCGYDNSLGYTRTAAALGVCLS